MQNSDELEKVLLDAKVKVRIAVIGAVLSFVGALVTAWLSYEATTRINDVTQKATFEIAQLKDQVERGSLATKRAEMVERLLVQLTSGEETKAKLAFLNLWQLHPDPTERSIFILMALEKSGQSVVKMMILLKSELGSHLEKIREAAEPTSCEEPGARDCAFTVNAKTLLMHIEPADTLKLLLKQMNSYSATENLALEDVNVEYINNIIKSNPKLISELEEEYVDNYKHLHILSYILYALDKKKHFREIIGENGDRSTQFQLVGGIVSEPLQEMQPEDWGTLIKIAISALDGDENSAAMLDMIRLLDRARVRNMLTDAHQSELESLLTKLATSAGEDIGVRRRAIGLLTNISSQTGLHAMKLIVEKETPLNRVLQVQIQQILEKPPILQWLNAHTNIQKLPDRKDDFEKWRELLLEKTL